MPEQPNVLFLMMDQLRFDAIAAHGNPVIYTPNLDRLAARGVSFSQAYSSCPVCVAARYTIRTGREPHTTGIWRNMGPAPREDQPKGVEERCGSYLPRRMRELGYRTFGVGKFHSIPWNEDLGYDVQLHSEEIYRDQEQRQGDAYATFIREQHPEFDFIYGLMGERTEMYYMPQMSPMPAEVTVESWAADRAIEQVASEEKKPYFGLVSFVGPHPPLAPPIPYNRLYDPDRMPNPVRGRIATDHMDEQIPWMNHAIWAEDVSDGLARVLRARYYGEVTYIDACIGRILDAAEAREDADNTLIVFFSDHGDLLGDHHGWQKESFFEQSANVPFMLSWPAQVDARGMREELATLTDLFGIATRAAGEKDLRDGADILGMLQGDAPAREEAVGLYGKPGTMEFKIMLRDPDWKYIFFAHGGQEQLFNLREDPHEVDNRAETEAERTLAMRRRAIAYLQAHDVDEALDGAALRAYPIAPRPLKRIYQLDPSRGILGFPDHPSDVLKTL